MSFQLTEEDKKSLAITTVVYALLILLLFLLRFWPPADMKIMGGGGGGGIEMNFGDSDFGMGDNSKSEVLNVKDEVKAALNQHPMKTSSQMITPMIMLLFPRKKTLK